ncbi:hypothetical protein V2K57_13275 [Pseudomonas alliivorans]|nr:hypothetical protein [Pseudomonas alliivorans]MEE4701814.1 hypothetical protein [Pseudomonas alliivorans]MEE4737342.1 hypothetical protein [Pseudomonas alliivorans]
MSNGAAVVEKLGPAGAGGLTMLLVGLCSKLPKEHQEIGILIASFIGPIICHIFISAIHRYMTPTSLAVYKKTLRIDVLDTLESIRTATPGSDREKQLQESLLESQLLLSKAGRDYYSGKLNFQKSGIEPGSQQSPH